MGTTKNRLKEYLVSKKISQRRFEQMIGVSNGYVNNLKSSPSSDVIQKILCTFPDLNSTWLISGEGNMLVDDAFAKQELQVSVKNISSGDADKVPLIPLNALGGTLVGFSEDSVRLSDCEMVKTPVDDVEFAIPIYGESMLPYYPSGCRVFVKKIDMSSYIIWGNVYVLDTTNGIILKEVQPSNREDYILCHSLNPSGKFKDFEVPIKDIRGMYRVMACLIAM